MAGTGRRRRSESRCRVWCAGRPARGCRTCRSSMALILPRSSRTLRVVAGNDAHFALLAEAAAGAARGVGNAVLIAIGTGIGSAVLADGRILRGEGGAAASFGWACADLGDAGDDAHGWLERVASGTALDRIAAGLGAADGPALVGRARDGDAKALAALDRADGRARHRACRRRRAHSAHSWSSLPAAWRMVSTCSVRCCDRRSSATCRRISAASGSPRGGSGRVRHWSGPASSHAGIRCGRRTGRDDQHPTYRPHRGRSRSGTRPSRRYAP